MCCSFEMKVCLLNPFKIENVCDVKFLATVLCYKLSCFRTRKVHLDNVGLLLMLLNCCTLTYVCLA